MLRVLDALARPLARHLAEAPNLEQAIMPYARIRALATSRPAGRRVVAGYPNLNHGRKADHA